jgi:hypothetical protein
MSKLNGSRNGEYERVVGKTLGEKSGVGIIEERTAWWKSSKLRAGVANLAILAVFFSGLIWWAAVTPHTSRSGREMIRTAIEGAVASPSAGPVVRRAELVSAPLPAALRSRGSYARPASFFVNGRIYWWLKDNNPEIGWHWVEVTPSVGNGKEHTVRAERIKTPLSAGIPALGVGFRTVKSYVPGSGDGYYAGGVGSSHKGGHYVNSYTGNHYRNRARGVAY